MRVETRLCIQDCRKNDDFTLSAMLQAISKNYIEFFNNYQFFNISCMIVKISCMIVVGLMLVRANTRVVMVELHDQYFAALLFAAALL